MPRGEIRALTALRGVAAMMVVLQHFSATMERHSADWIPSIVPHGYMAVDLFFVLSGFIMAYTYLADFQTRGLREFPDFLLKRVARIVPLNTAAVLLVLLGGAISQALLARNIVYVSDNPVYDTVCNLLMLQGIGVGRNLNGPSWSISTEFAAYFLFPLLLIVASSRRLAVPVLGAVASVAALTIVALNHPYLGLDTSSVAGGLTRCLAGFTLGLATYRAVTIPAVRRLMAPDGVAATIIVLALALLVLRYDLLIVLVVPFVVATLACNHGRVEALMTWRLPYFLGVISFSIYLLHSPLRPAWLLLWQTLHPEPMSGPLALLLAFVGSMLIILPAWAGYVLVERPGRGLVRGLANRLRRPTARKPQAAPRTVR